MHRNPIHKKTHCRFHIFCIFDTAENIRIYKVHWLNILAVHIESAEQYGGSVMAGIHASFIVDQYFLLFSTVVKI